MSADKLVRDLSTQRRQRRASEDTSLPFQETTEMQDPRFEAFRVPGPADGLFYIHDFISEAEEDHLVKSPSPSPRARRLQLARKVADEADDLCALSLVEIGESPLPKWQTVPTGRRCDLFPAASPSWPCRSRHASSSPLAGARRHPHLHVHRPLTYPSALAPSVFSDYSTGVRYVSFDALLCGDRRLTPGPSA
jgi:hypothetical protein